MSTASIQLDVESVSATAAAHVSDRSQDVEKQNPYPNSKVAGEVGFDVAVALSLLHQRTGLDAGG